MYKQKRVSQPRREVRHWRTLTQDQTPVVLWRFEGWAEKHTWPKQFASTRPPCIVPTCGKSGQVIAQQLNRSWLQVQGDRQLLASCQKRFWKSRGVACPVNKFSVEVSYPDPHGWWYDRSRLSFRLPHANIFAVHDYRQSLGLGTHMAQRQ